VLIEQIDGINPESFDRCLGDLLNALWPAIQTGPTGTAIRIELEAEFGGDYQLPAEWSKRFAHQILVGVWTIDLSRIEECDATVNRGMK
jgi:hypothetical protein